MAKVGVRFDNAFLFGQLEKRKNWKKKGVKAGHGGDFNIDDPLKEINREVRSLTDSISVDALNTKLVDTSEIPQWLVSILDNDVDVARAVLNKRVSLDSPHKTRLAQGIKRPQELNNSMLAEHWLQVRLFYTLERYRPDIYDPMFAVPNGGYRSPKSAAMMPYEGQKKGTPDIFIPVPRGVYHGMFLEVKTEKGVASKIQKQRLKLYEDKGYHAVIGKGFGECLDLIYSYFELPTFDGKSRLSII